MTEAAPARNGYYWKGEEMSRQMHRQEGTDSLPGRGEIIGDGRMDSTQADEVVPPNVPIETSHDLAIRRDPAR